MCSLKRTGVALLCLVWSGLAFSQQLRLGKTPLSLQKSAILELESDNQGLLLPRITDTTLINSLIPPDGMVIFHQPSQQLMIRSNGSWRALGTPDLSNFWTLTGNAGINSSTNFIGTTDDKQVILKSNSSSYLELGRRATLGLTQAYTDYNDNNEQVTHLRSALQFYAPAAQLYKPKIFVDANGNFRVKGSAAGTDYFEFGSTGTSNSGGFEFITGDEGDEPILFKNYNSVTGMSETMRLQSGRVAIGSSAFDATNPEKLLVDAGTTTSYNLMTAKGSINNYLQINVQNRSGGNQASSDIVATANNGNESDKYIDMGINSGGFSYNTYPMLDGNNTAYLYATGNDFVIGNAASNKNLRFFTGGYALTNERMKIESDGDVGIGLATATAAIAKLDVAGTQKLGDKGTVQKNLISFEYSVNPAVSVPGGSMNILLSSFSSGELELNITIPSANTPSSTRATVMVSPDRDLTSHLSIASARLTSTSNVKIRILNNSTSSTSIAVNTKLYITIMEF